MKQSRDTRCLPAVTLALALGAAVSAQSVIRPITDFTSKQGTAVNYWPPVGDYGGWGTEDFSVFGIMDYAGVANEYLKKNHNKDLGTSFEGFVVEERIPGKPNDRLVTVLLHTRNALTFGSPVPEPFPGWPYPLAGGIGYRAADEISNPDPMGTVAKGKPAALGDCYLYLVFVTHNNGGDLPDYLKIEGEDRLFLHFVGNAQGELRPPYPAGSKGRLHITQVAMFTKSNPNFPVWTAELVDIQQIGKK